MLKSFVETHHFGEKSFKAPALRHCDFCKSSVSLAKLTAIRLAFIAGEEAAIDALKQFFVAKPQDLRRTKLLGLLSRAGKRSIGDAAWLVLC
jgi:hypothetical protein